MVNVRAGELRHRVTFQSLVKSRDALNAPVETYTDHVTVWASVEYGTGREFWQAQQANSEVQGVVRIRHRTDITPEMRIKYGNKNLKIIAPFASDTSNVEMHIPFRELL